MEEETKCISCPSDEIDNNKCCIEAFYPYLNKQLEPFQCKFIAQRFEHLGIFTKEQQVDIERKEGVNVTHLFLDTLLKCIDKPSCYSSFLDELKFLEFHHVVDMLEGNQLELSVIEQAWEDSLKENYHEIISEFDPKYLLRWYGRKLLGDEITKIVEAEPTPMRKCQKLFYHLQKKPDWLPTLLDAMKDDRCGNLSAWIERLDPKGDVHGLTYVNLIKAFYERIAMELEPKDVIYRMEMRDESRKYVVQKKTREERVKAFLGVLKSQPPGWFKHFITALSECHPKYSELVYLLDPTVGVAPPVSNTKDSSSENNKDASTVSNKESSIVSSTMKVAGEPSNENNLKAIAESSYLAADHQDKEASNRSFSSSMEQGEHELNVTLEHTQEVVGGPSDDVDLKSTIRSSNSSASSPNQQPTAPRNENENDLDVREKHEDEAKESDKKKDTETGRQALKLRDYQAELAKPALERKNCMIVAPTGSGKTFVALHICLEHIKNTKDAKVVFLVPRVPLVQQQYSLFSRFLPEKPDTIFQVTGESGSAVPVHISIRRHIVTIMTAQILMNLLSEEIMKISEITLLIIDECHHTVKNDPYNMIMRVYLDQLQQEESLPQVVGLTASPGMGKAKTMKKAHENIKTLMANLDVTTAPVQVNTTVQDLLQFQHEAQDEVIPVQRRETDQFCSKIKQAMKEIQTCIETDVKLYENNLEGRVQFDLRAAPGSQDYESWAVSLLNKSKLIKDDATSQRFMAYAVNIREYNTALMLNDHVRNWEAKEYIEESLFNEPPRNDVELNMKDIYDKYTPDVTEDTNPMLDRLTLCLAEEFNRKPNSRCIMFVKTRAIAKALLNYLMDNAYLRDHKLNPKQLTGAGARSDSFGMTKIGQEDTLKSFREGSCKVLVATSVAEEGLDIKECNLIITYNYSTNEIGQVQRKGRGRAKDSKVIMLAYVDSGHVKRERENSIRVELTQEILSNIQKMDPKVLESEIRAIQASLKKDREFDRTVKLIKQKRKKPSHDVYKLSCIWCKRQVTTSDQLRHIKNQHRVITDPQFGKKARYREVPEGDEGKLIGDEQFVIGKIYCANPECGREWGLRMRYKSCPISVPKISSFLITGDKGYRAVKKQWKEAPFAVDKPLTVEDLNTLTEMVASTSAQPDEAEEFEALTEGLNL